MFVFASILLGLSPTAHAAFWTDDFPAPSLNSRWSRGGAGTIGIRSGGGIFASSYLSSYSEDWHGPYVRAESPNFSDFNITARFRCIGEGKTNRLMVRILDASKAKIFSFGWSDFLAKDDKAEIGLYGSSDTFPIHLTGASAAYYSFYDKDITLARTGDRISFYVDGFLQYAGQSSQATASFIEVAFLKYRGECTIQGSMDMKRITFSTAEMPPPGPPRNRTHLKGNGYVNLSWDPPSDDGGSPVTGYKVYRGAETGSEIYLTTVPGDWHNDTGLTNGQVYHYRVSALSANGEGEMCPAISAVPMTVPLAPSFLSAIAGTGTVLLSWNAPASDGGSPLTGYGLYRSTDGSPQSFASLGPVTEYSDTDVTDGQTYHYRVSALNAVGEGPLSESTMAITPSVAEGSPAPATQPTALPTAPRGLAAAPGDGKVALAWSSPLYSGNLPILGFNIYRGTEPQSMHLLTTIPQVLAFEDATVTNGMTYTYHVTALNSLGEGPPSNTATTSPMNDSVPSAPLNLAIVAANQSAILTWEAPAKLGNLPLLGYRVYRGTASESQSLVAELGNVHTYVDLWLLDNTTYHYSVKAFNSKGEGPAANASATTPSPVQPITNPEDAAEVTDDTVQPLTWKDNFAPTTSIATIIALAVGLCLAYLFLREPGRAKASGKAQDQGVDDEAEKYGAEEESGENQDGDLLPEGGG